MFLDAPRGLRDPDRVSERVAMLGESGFREMTRWTKSLAERRESIVPSLDPAEAGSNARVLLLMEAPGPMTNPDGARIGSGFISVDNDDSTAENLWKARAAAGLHDGALLWNIVPWYLGPASRKPSASELREGGDDLRELLTHLPELHTVVTLGRFAQRGWREYARPGSSIGVRTIQTWHPSPLSMNQANHRMALTAALRRASLDWRTTAHQDSFELQFDLDRGGNTVSAWYVDRAGDRIDVHPRWWNSPFD